MESYLSMCALVVYFCQEPVNPPIARQEDGVWLPFLLLPHSLFELDGNGHQLLAGIHIEQTYWCRDILAFSDRETIHNGQVTDVDITSLGKIF